MNRCELNWLLVTLAASMLVACSSSSGPARTVGGTVTGLSEHTVTLRVADQVKLEFDRSAIGRVTAGQGEKDA